MGGFIFLFILFAVVAIAIGAAKARNTQAAWAAAAAELGYEQVSRGSFSRPEIRGRGGMFEVRIDTKKSDDATFTRYRVDFPTTGPPFRLTRQHAFSRITKLFGAQDVEVGDQAFDDAFIVKSDHPDALQSWITPSRRLALVRLAALGHSLEVRDGSIRLQIKGLETNSARIVSITRRLLSVARELSGDANVAVDRVLEAQRGGEFAEAADLMEALLKDKTDDIEGRLTEVEVLASSGERERAATVLEELEAQLPADPEVAGWRRVVDAPPPPPPPAPSTAPPAGDEVFEELFASDRLSHDTTRIFEAKYKGTSVAWSGAVRSVRRYSRDLDLGDQPGTKAVITVAEVMNDLYGNTKIDAVVHLPETAADHLERGQRVSFTGVLSKIDPLMRNIFVAEAQLS